MRLAGTWMRYSNRAMDQLTSAAISQGRPAVSNVSSIQGVSLRLVGFDFEIVEVEGGVGGGVADEADPGEFLEFWIVDFEGGELFFAAVGLGEGELPGVGGLGAEAAGEVEMDPLAGGHWDGGLAGEFEFAVADIEHGAGSVRLAGPVAPFMDQVGLSIEEEIESTGGDAFGMVDFINQVRIPGLGQAGGVLDFEALFTGGGVIGGDDDGIAFAFDVTFGHAGGLAGLGAFEGVVATGGRGAGRQLEIGIFDAVGQLVPGGVIAIDAGLGGDGFEIDFVEDGGLGFQVEVIIFGVDK